ncbi:MAG: PFL family protein [Oscillospiraceae bacterium]|nr:PFL family protein [Oscillospiraceae bacterium]
MINTFDILETIKMISEEHLDVRTVTMGISLRDCCSESLSRLCGRVYDKIARKAEHLVAVCRRIESEYGLPIVNRRVSVTPAALLCDSVDASDVTPLALALDRAAAQVGVNFIGGWSALVHKGETVGDRRLIASIPGALSQTARVCSSVNVATTRAGINMDAVNQMGHTVLACAALTGDRDSVACGKLVVFANAPEDNPFMAGAFHGVGECECAINVGVSGPGAVRAAIERAGDCSLTELAEVIKRTAFKITRMGQLVAAEASKRLGASFGIVDLSLAPTPARGDSVAQILRGMGLDQVGGYGTTAALAMLNDAVKKGGIMASSHVGGLSGAFIPVSEDMGMVEAVAQGTLTLEKLEAMTAVCSVGLDMVVIPGDVTASLIAAIIADEIAIGVINNKTTAVRVIPAHGKRAGDMVNFGGLLGRSPVMEVNRSAADRFVGRGGRIPAPLHAQKN